MSIWSKIFNLLFLKTKDTESAAAAAAADKVILFVDDLVNRKELVMDCASLYEESKKKSGEERDKFLVKTYLCYENFVTGNKPLIVKKEFNKRDLRAEIRKNFKDKNLSPDIKIIFLPNELQILEIFRMATKEIFAYAISNIGFEYTKEIFSKSVAGNILSRLISFQNKGIIITATDDQALDLVELISLLKNLFSTLKKELENKFGGRVIAGFVTNFYSSFKEIYTFEFLQIFLQLVPDDILEEEKISILAREELETRLSLLMSEERKKRETTQELAIELQRVVEELNSSKAATLNLLEDVSRERDYVEGEIKKRTMQLREEKALLKSTIESLPLSFFSVDKNFDLLDYNKALCRIFLTEKFNNFSEIEEKLRPFFAVRDKCNSVLETNNPIIAKEVDFDSRFYKIYLVPVKDGESQTLGVLCLLEDITEQKVVERSREEFFSIASHELRTPLTAIRGNASMILEFFVSNLPGKEVEQMITDIHDASIRLIKIVNDFLDVSKIEQEKVIFEKDNVDLKSLLKVIFREYESIAISKNLILKLGKMEGDNLIVVGDKDRLKQIITNLLSNAMNYTRKGSVVIDLKKEDEKIYLYVKDTGIGISKNNQVLLFRKFQQAQGKILTRDITRSTGLGLYISKLLAEAMGGKVELFESQEGVGSTFRLIMPAKL